MSCFWKSGVHIDYRLVLHVVQVKIDNEMFLSPIIKEESYKTSGPMHPNKKTQGPNGLDLDSFNEVLEVA